MKGLRKGKLTGRTNRHGGGEDAYNVDTGKRGNTGGLKDGGRETEVVT